MPVQIFFLTKPWLLLQATETAVAKAANQIPSVHVVLAHTRICIFWICDLKMYHKLASISYQCITNVSAHRIIAIIYTFIFGLYHFGPTHVS